jgi:hypothetical protein
MINRTQEQRDTIVANLSQPYTVENILTQEDIAELISIWNNRDNKIQKNTGPITSDLSDFKNIPVLVRLFEKIKQEIGGCEIYTSFYFYVNYPHIIHNDDDKLGPVVYKAITIPLELTYTKEFTGYPSLCMFDQYYLEGPSKFFGGSTIDIPTYYNAQVYEYSQVQNKSNAPFDEEVYKKYMSHLKPFWLKGLSFNSAQEWRPGNAIIFDCVRLHCASNFLTQGIKSKLGISIFTKVIQ